MSLRHRIGPRDRVLQSRRAWVYAWRAASVPCHAYASTIRNRCAHDETYTSPERACRLGGCTSRVLAHSHARESSCSYRFVFLGGWSPSHCRSPERSTGAEAFASDCNRHSRSWLGAAGDRLCFVLDGFAWFRCCCHITYWSRWTDQLPEHERTSRENTLADVSRQKKLRGKLRGSLPGWF